MKSIGIRLYFMTLAFMPVLMTYFFLRECTNWILAFLVSAAFSYIQGRMIERAIRFEIISRYMKFTERKGLLIIEAIKGRI